MNRILLSVILLSSLVFLVCLVQNSGSSMYSFAMASQTQMPSQTQLYLMGIQRNPWFGISLASQLIFAVSLFGAAILFVSQKLLANPQRDAP
jgi:hypothetical protein